MARRKLATVVLGVTGAATLGVWAPVAAEAAVVCGQTITTSVTLTNDLSCPSGTGIFVNAPNVTVDLGGHTITGAAPAGGTSRGVNITPNRPNVTVRNGTIRGFDAGVSVNAGSTGALITLLTLDANGVGVQANTGSASARIVGNTITNTAPFSAMQLGGNGHVAEGNTMTHGANAGIFLAGDDDVLNGNTIIDMGASGIAISAFPSTPGPFMNNRISGNTVSGSGRLFNSTGISLTNASGTVVQGNNVTGRLATPGLFVHDSPGTDVTGNALTNNTTGVLVRGSGSVGTLLAYNSATANQSGIHVESAPTNTRVVGNNASNNTAFDGILIQSPSTLVAANTANANAHWGINAVPGTVDGGGNRAAGNGVAAQCTPNIVCT